MQAVLFKSSGQTWWKLGGMTLLERNLRLLETAGCTTVMVLHPPGDTLPDLAVPRPLQLEVYSVPVALAAADPLTLLPQLQLSAHTPLFFLDANLLVDARVFTALKLRTPPCFMVSANGSPDHLIWRVGWFTPDDIAAGKAVTQQADHLLLTAIEQYDAEVGSEVPAYCQKVNKESDLPYGWRVLIDRVSRRPADLIRKYVAQPIENWLVHRLCDTAVTPNHVTLLSVAVALAGASLFYQGWFFLALAFAWGAILLDGVDEKLARVKLMSSPLGQLEHIVGFLSENTWYWALGARLATTHDPMAWSLGIGITACGICDNILRAFFIQIKGKDLEDIHPFDRWFCLIGGRASVYVCTLFIGFLLGFPLVALQIVLWWAAITLLVHLARAGYHLVRRTH